MRRTILILLCGGLIFALGLSLVRSRPRPKHAPQLISHAELIVPDEREVVMTLPPLVITVPRPHPPRVPPRITLNAAIPPLPEAPDAPALLCGGWRPLASDETQTVRYCEPR